MKRSFNCEDLSSIGTTDSRLRSLSTSATDEDADDDTCARRASKRPRTFSEDLPVGSADALPPLPLTSGTVNPEVVPSLVVGYRQAQQPYHLNPATAALSLSMGNHPLDYDDAASEEDEQPPPRCQRWSLNKAVGLAFGDFGEDDEVDDADGASSYSSWPQFDHDDAVSGSASPCHIGSFPWMPSSEMPPALVSPSWPAVREVAPPPALAFPELSSTAPFRLSTSALITKDSSDTIATATTTCSSESFPEIPHVKAWPKSDSMDHITMALSMI